MKNTTERKLGDFSRFDDVRLAEIFETGRNDPCVLHELNEELKRRGSDASLNLHLKVAAARRALERVRPKAAHSSQRPEQSGPVRNWLRAFLSARNLDHPNKRPLHRYRMTDEEYERAKGIIRRLADTGRLAEPDDRAGALFVAYCAEWFRRESTSTLLRWDDLSPGIFPDIPYKSKQELTTRGLAFWGRPLRRSDQGREFLLTVALEGGFPVRILVEGAGGWLKEYLRVIMRRAIAWRFDRPEELRTIAVEERGRMRKSYQHDDFIALCSELVTSLLELRRRVENDDFREIRNTALLDATYPGWRDELSIHVPEKDEALVEELLAGLLDDKMTGLTTEGVEVRRYLVRRNGEWRAALQILADGEIPPAKLPSLPALGRVRAIAVGELGNHIAGEIALLEPPVGEQQRWRVRPAMRTAKLLCDFPFAAPVNATLTSPGGPPQPWTWPRGEALRSDVLVFETDAGATPQQPLLRFLRAGSVSSPAKTLFVLVPRGWAVEPATEGAVTEIEDVASLDRKLVRLIAAAYFSSGELDAVRFRVEPDTVARQLELEIPSFGGSGFLLADQKWELVTTPAHPRVRESSKQPRPAGRGELFVRRPGGRWLPFAGALDGAGLTELSWRDPIAGIQLEKRQLALVPSGASIVGRMTDSQGVEIRLHELRGWTASVREAGCFVDETGESVLSFRFAGRPRYRLTLTLRPPNGQPFDVVVPLTGREAAVVLADGSILAAGQRVDAGGLRGAVAVAPRPTILHLASKGVRTGGLRTTVDGELPLGALSAAITEALAAMPGQDDLVELEFVGDARRPIRISRYRQDQLRHDAGIVAFQPGVLSDGVPVARMILDPRHEHALEATGPGAWRLPERCEGPCLVYLRDGLDVASRPAPILRPGTPDRPAGRLASAMAIPEFAERRQAIADALHRFGHTGGDAADLNWLLDATINLNGLPPSAFDALKLLPSQPEALVTLLLGARDAAERTAIWNLQNELPFLWLALPFPAWGSALAHSCTNLAHALEHVLGERKATIEAVAWLRRICAELMVLEPALAAVFALSQLPVTSPAAISSLRDLSNGYIRDQHSRGGEALNDFAAELAAVGLRLPPDIETKSHADFAGLFAPVLLAASARERLCLSHGQALLVRRTLREDPVYVSTAWRHLIEFYGSRI